MIRAVFVILLCSLGALPAAAQIRGSQAPKPAVMPQPIPYLAPPAPAKAAVPEEPKILYGTPPRPVAMPKPTEGVFRNFIWGVSPEDVKTFETAVLLRDDGDALVFVEQPSRKDFRRTIRYDFRNGKFWRGTYEFQDLDDPNADTILNIHEDFKRAMIGQYGKPSDEELIWTKLSPYKNHPKFWGRAVFSKALKFRTVWEQDATKVVLENYFLGPHYRLAYMVENAPLANAEAAKVDLLPQFSDSPPAP